MELAENSTDFSLNHFARCAARQRLPDFMSESPFDGRVTRRVKMAANVIDRFRFVSQQISAVFFVSTGICIPSKHFILFFRRLMCVTILAAFTEVLLCYCYSVRLGVFLRRYPVARVFIIVYMVS